MSSTQVHASQSRQLSSPLILVVEDEYLIRDVVADDLRTSGYRVVEAASADEARDMIVAGVPVDLVFSDVRMPGSIDGLQLLCWIRSDYPTLTVILCSGHLDPHDAFDCGAQAFLAKPYRLDEVIHSVDICLNRAH